MAHIDALLNYGMAKKAKSSKRVIPRFKTRVRRKHYFKAWRKHRDLTLERAAELAGMTAGNISAMERYDQGYTQDALEALADVYKVPPGWLTDVDPAKLAGILPLWDRAKEDDRRKIIEIARTIVGGVA